MFLTCQVKSIRKVAGLPNITGGFECYNYNAYAAYGVLYLEELYNDNSGNWANGNRCKYFRNGFNASIASNIYGSSNTVTPLSLSCKIVLKY